MPSLGSLPLTLIEVAVLSALIYVVLRFLRETRGSGVVRGLALLLVAGFVGFQVLIQVLRLERLGLLFNAIAQSVVIALVIVFHPEIRRAIVHIGDSPIFGRLFPKESKIVQRVLRAVARLMKERIGALIAIERDASLQSLVESGITIDAELNSFLIETIFYPKSALHDGAIVVREDRIVAASCLLPLSQNPDIDKRLGTRHRAALGLSEETDALAIVVSEETGKVSVALGGKLFYDLSLEQLERHIDEALGLRQRTQRKEGGRRTPWAALFHDPLRKLAAVVLGIAVYYLLDNQVRDTYQVPMRLMADAANEATERGNRLVIKLPDDRLAVQSFVDSMTGEVIADREVMFAITGPKHKIEQLRATPLQLPVEVPDVDWEKTHSADFTVRDVRRTVEALNDPGISMVMTPPSIRINVERMDDLPVPMSLGKVDLRGNHDSSRLRRETVEFSPDTVHVVGKAEALAHFRQDPTPFTVDLTPRENALQAVEYVELKPEHAARGLRLEQPCTMTMQINPKMKPFTFVLPIDVDDLALPPAQRGQFEPEQPTAEVTIAAGGKLLALLVPKSAADQQQWASEHMRLEIWIEPRENSVTTLPARLKLVGVDQYSDSEYALVNSKAIVLRKRQQ